MIAGTLTASYCPTSGGGNRATGPRRHLEKIQCVFSSEFLFMVIWQRTARNANPTVIILLNLKVGYASFVRLVRACRVLRAQSCKHHST